MMQLANVLDELPRIAISCAILVVIVSISANTVLKLQQIPSLGQITHRFLGLCSEEV
jgi:hypothetical protein